MKQPYQLYMDQKSQMDVMAFCDYFNEHYQDFKDREIEKFMDIMWIMLVGEKAEVLHKGVRQEFFDYVKEHLGLLKVDFFASGAVRKIQLGDVSAGPLYLKEFEEEELQHRLTNHLRCGAVVPSQENPKALLLSINQHFIMGQYSANQQAEEDNIYFGEYYFNRQKVLSSSSSVELVKLSLFNESLLQETLISFDADGKKKETDYINELKSFKNGEYTIISQYPLAAAKYRFLPLRDTDEMQEIHLIMR